MMPRIKARLRPRDRRIWQGLIIPGISRLDYDFTCEGGYFPAHIETNNDPDVARWLENVIHMLPIAPRPEHYNPLDEKRLDREWIRRLGQSGKDCYAAILAKDAHALGASMNECMRCWEAILPCTVRHPAISVDLVGYFELLPIAGTQEPCIPAAAVGICTSCRKSLCRVRCMCRSDGGEWTVNSE